MPAANDLVTLERCKQGLNITEGDWDMQIDTLVSAASEMVLDYIDDTVSAEFIVTAGVDQTLVPVRVQQATIEWVRTLFDQSEANPSSDGDAPPLVKRLLRSLRTPKLA